MQRLILFVFLLVVSASRVKSTHFGSKLASNAASQNLKPRLAGPVLHFQSPNKRPLSSSGTTGVGWVSLGPLTLQSPKKVESSADRASQTTPNSSFTEQTAKPSSQSAPTSPQGIPNQWAKKPDLTLAMLQYEEEQVKETEAQKEPRVPVMSKDEFQEKLDSSKLYKYFEKLSYDGPYAMVYAGVAIEDISDVSIADLNTDFEIVDFETVIKQMIMKKWFLPVNFRKHLTTVEKSTLIKTAVIGVHFWSITKRWPFDLDIDTESAIHEVQSYFDSPKLPESSVPNFLYDNSTGLPQLFSKATALDGEQDLRYMRAFWNFSRVTGIELDLVTKNGAVASTSMTPSSSAPWVNATRPFDIFIEVDLNCKTKDLGKATADFTDFQNSISLFLSDCKAVMTAAHAEKYQDYYRIYKTRFEACKKNKLPFVFPLIIFTRGHSSCALMLPDGRIWTLGDSEHHLAQEFKQKARGELSEADFIEMTTSYKNIGWIGFTKCFNWVKLLDIVDLPQKAPNCMHKTFFDLFRLFSRYHERDDAYDLFVKSAVRKSYQRLVTAASEKISLKVDLPRVVTKAALSSADIYESLEGAMLEFWNNGELSNSALLEGIVESEIVRHLRLKTFQEDSVSLAILNGSFTFPFPPEDSLDAPQHLRDNFYYVDPNALSAVEQILYIFSCFTLGIELTAPLPELHQLFQDKDVPKWQSEYLFEKRSRFNLFELAGLFKVPLTSYEIAELFNAVYPNIAVLLAHFPQFIPMSEQSFVSMALNALKVPLNPECAIQCLDYFDNAIGNAADEHWNGVVDFDFQNRDSYYEFCDGFEATNQFDFGIACDLASLVWRRIALPHLLLAKYRFLQTGTSSKLKLPLLAEPNQVLLHPDSVTKCLQSEQYERLLRICGNLTLIIGQNRNSVDAKLWSDFNTHVQIMESVDGENPENAMIPDGTDAIGTPFSELYAYLGEESTA